MKELIPAALRLANQVHWGQVDKAGQPYIWHPIRVSLKFSHSKDQIVGLLHDTVEDADADLWPRGELKKEIYSSFGLEVGDAVEAITHRPNEYLPDYWARVKANPIALMVKVEDIHDNVYRIDQIPDQDTRDRLTVKYARALEALT